MQQGKQTVNLLVFTFTCSLALFDDGGN